MSDRTPRDPELALSLVYLPPARRPAMATLWRLDERLGAIVAEPNGGIAAIKLAWWREALERLDGAPPPPEPLLRAIAAELLPFGVTGAELAGVAAGWDILLMDQADEAMLLRYAHGRGGALFAIAARLLGGAGSQDAVAAGEIWALTTVPPAFAAAARTAAMERVAVTPHHRWPRGLRALGVLAVLARDRVMREGAVAGSPRRVGRALWHGISGW